MDLPNSTVSTLKYRRVNTIYPYLDVTMLDYCSIILEIRENSTVLGEKAI